jgi:MFS family permease
VGSDGSNGARDRRGRQRLHRHERLLPAIESDFDADLSMVQWVVSGYALVFGVLIVPGGRLAAILGLIEALLPDSKAGLAGGLVILVTLLGVPTIAPDAGWAEVLPETLDVDTLTSGLMLVPFVGVFAVAAFLETWVLNRVGMKAVITAGAACIFDGALLFVVLFDDASGYRRQIPGMVVLGVGVGLFYPSVTTAALTALDSSKSSLAGGLVSGFRWTFALGALLALIGLAIAASGVGGPLSRCGRDASEQ